MSGSRAPEASGSFWPASSLVRSRAQSTHADTVSPRTPPTLAQTIPPPPPHRCLVGANQQRQRQFVAPHR
eukprot:7360997-Prymnesium_polylepis.1